MRQIVLLPCVHVAHLLCFAWVKFSFLTSFITIFGIGFHKSLGTYRDSYWLLQLEDVVHLQTCLFAFFSFFWFWCNGLHWLAHPKKKLYTCTTVYPITFCFSCESFTNLISLTSQPLDQGLQIVKTQGIFLYV